MEIHKPKAAHSFREFLTEIGTIICGILIALGLEQAVETVHRDQEVREAREALRQEIAQDEQRLSLAVQATDCEMGQIEARFAWAAGGAKPARLHSFLPLLRAGAWETVKATAVPHMPLDERVQLSAFYDQLSNIIQNADQKRAHETELASFDGLPALSSEQRDNLLRSTTLAERSAQTLIGTAARLKEVAAGVLGPNPPPVKLPPVLKTGVDWACGRTAVNPFGENVR